MHSTFFRVECAPQPLGSANWENAMRYLLKCCDCGATVWAGGEDDPNTNSTTIHDDKGLDWPENGCDHEEYDIIDSEYEPPMPQPTQPPPTQPPTPLRE